MGTPDFGSFEDFNNFMDKATKNLEAVALLGEITQILHEASEDVENDELQNSLAQRAIDAIISYGDRRVMREITR